LLFNCIFYKYYVDPTESYSLAGITVVLTMSIGLLCVLLIPIDVFLVSYKESSINNIQINRDYLKDIMYLLYGMSLFFAFFLIPFAYFYGEERIEDIKSNEFDYKEKICTSLKYTVNITLK